MNSLTSGFYLSKSYCDHRPIRNQNSSKIWKNNLRNDTHSLTPLYVEVAKLMIAFRRGKVNLFFIKLLIARLIIQGPTWPIEIRPNMKASISNNLKSIKHIGFRFHISLHTCNSWIPCEIRYQILKIGEVFAPPQQKFNDRKQSQITTKIVIFWHMRRLQYSLKAVKIWIHFIQSSEFKWRKTKTWHKISLKIVYWAK